jgi:hypothetical protein
MAEILSVRFVNNQNIGKRKLQRNRKPQMKISIGFTNTRRVSLNLPLV